MADAAVVARRSVWRTTWDSPILLLALTALIWAGHAIVGRLAVGEIGPMMLVFLRWGVASGPIAFAARKTLRADLRLLWPRWPLWAAMGALGFTAFNALFYAAAHYTTALNMSLIQAASPALVLIGATAVFGVRTSFAQAFGAALTILGVAVISTEGDWRRLADLNLNFGDALMLLASAIYAFYTLGLRMRPAVSAFGFLAFMAIAAFVTSIPLFAMEAAMRGVTWPTWKGWLVLVYAALGPAFLAQVFYMRGVQLIGPSRAGVFVNLVPVFGALLAVALLGEPLQNFHMAALALVAAGIVIAQRKS
jgi:drug/metabolite transporter (DMT)-like permease